MEKVMILGTEYRVTYKEYDDDPAFERRKINGYCDSNTHDIVICLMRTYPGWEDEMDDWRPTEEECLRHEVVHAYLNESGLSDSAAEVIGSWAKNEEMVDWFALQGPKIYKTWQELGVA